MRRNIIVIALFMLNACVMLYGCQPITKQLLAEIYIAQGNDYLKHRYINIHSGFVRDTYLIHDTNFIDAIAKFTMALEINPGSAEAYYNRGFSYSILNNPDRACPDFQKACELGDCDGLKSAIKMRFCRDNIRYNLNYSIAYFNAGAREGTDDD